MPDRKEEEPVEFKVVDRRKFTSEGELRPDAEPSGESEAPAKPEAQARPAASAVPPPPPPPPAQSSAQPRPSADSAAGAAQPSSAPAGGIQFEHLVMSLVTQAMLQLGLATRPGELAPKPDLNAAHETIDILGILQEKTRGNLTPHEEQLLVGSLSELRLAYVEITRHSAGRIN